MRLKFSFYNRPKTSLSELNIKSTFISFQHEFQKNNINIVEIQISRYRFEESFIQEILTTCQKNSGDTGQTGQTG